jgi:predicted nuclease of predicted toxin-antitoxin system
MKLLLDQGLPRSAAEILRGAGFDTVHTGEIGLAKAKDSAIIEYALADSRFIVTLDADFHALIALSGATFPSVIRIRIERLRGEEVAQLLYIILNQCQKDLEAGAFVSVSEHQIKVRRLPIVR